MRITSKKNRLAKLDNVLDGSRTLLILIHDYPDPDAIASAMVLAHLARERYKLRTRIAYGGLITRAENRAMVQQLRIPLTHVDEIRWNQYGCVAMVDTQPGFGNHSLPQEVSPVVVIDHHQSTKPLHTAFVDVRTEYGASATILLEYSETAELELNADVATAVAYAIRSETHELGRDASRADIDAYLAVYPKANKRKLAKISNPKLPKRYFILLNTALQETRIFRHLAHVHLGEVESPEFVAQIADLLLQRERIGWSLVSGRFGESLFISLRCNHPKANAGNTLKRIVGPSGSAGGHARMAGGQVPLNRHTEQDWTRLEGIIVTRFLHKLGYKKHVEWKSMLLRDST